MLESMFNLQRAVVTAVFVLFALTHCDSNPSSSSRGSSQSRGCTAVKYAYGSKGFSQIEVPTEMVQENLKVCPFGYTCCTQAMEQKLNEKSQEEFDKIMAEKVGLLRNTYISRSAKFDEFFTELLDNSKRDLHNMFVRTYGLLYQQNSYIFTDLFQELRNYYKGADVSLVEVLESFFTRLLEKLFVILHTSYEFDDSYLECITNQMDQLKPFGDVPQKMSTQVKRAFIAARTFVQGLVVGRDVVIAVSKIEPTVSCRKAMMKMIYCPYCSGQPHVKPCNNLCMNVMKGCLSHHADLSSEWDMYIDSLMKLAERLEGPFNIESVVDPIDVKISDAIMNFQESAQSISDKVFQGCGRPPLKRNKRDTASTYDDTAYTQWSQPKGRYVHPTTAAGTSLDRLVRDIKEKVATTTGFWQKLPGEICTEMAAATTGTEESYCWNGNSVGRYLPGVVKDGLVNQLNNPEVEVDVRHPSAVVQQQLLRLRLINNKLKNAYLGVDVDWVDSAGDPEPTRPSADSIYDGSGSGDHSTDGSGSGQTYRPIEREWPRRKQDDRVSVKAELPLTQRPVNNQPLRTTTTQSTGNNIELPDSGGRLQCSGLLIAVWTIVIGLRNAWLA